MGFNNFRLQVIFRVLALVASISLFWYINFNPQFIGTLLVTGFFIGLQVILLIRYIEKSNQQYDKFLDSIHYDDFTETFSSKGEGEIFDHLYQKFNNVMLKFREIRAEKEAEAHYYRTVVQHVGTGILSFKKNGDIHLVNNAAKRLLQFSRLHNIHELKLADNTVAQTLFTLEHGAKTLLKIDENGQQVQLAVNAIEIRLRGEEYKLLSIQNIQRELEEKEMEAWQNLIKVLTHEIMNSVTPISSLANSLSDELSGYLHQEKAQYIIAKDDLADMEKAMHTIQRRSEGLVHFVNDFRNLSQVPQPKISRIHLGKLFQHLALLMQAELEKNNISFIIIPPPEGIILAADEHLIEQVLINLVKNAIQALFEQEMQKQIILQALTDEKSRLVIEVIDNGPGLKKEAAEKIFIPFYTTKKSGSGIGLSISRQIMWLHNGTISVVAAPEGGSIFRLQF